MLRSYMTVAVLSCMALGAPQHRFAMPSQFSFRTFHVPSPPPAIPKPARLTGPETIQEVSHIPVMVSVPNDFVGDSVVVTSEDLNNMGLASVKIVEEIPSAVEEVAAPVEVQPEIIVDEVQPEIIVQEETQPEITVVEEIQPEITAEEVVEIIPEESAAPLSQTDEAFVLTATEPEMVNEPVIVEDMPVQTPVEQDIPIEIVPEVMEEPIQPAPVQETAINPLDTDTFKAYNDFLNTWLQLASVNLNRPDLLNLRHIPVSQAAARVAPVEIAPEPIPEVVQEPIVQEIIPEMAPEPIVEEIILEPLVEEAMPEMVPEPVVMSNPEPVIEEEIFEPVTEMTPEAVAEEIVTEVIPEEIPATDVLPEPEAITESVPIISKPEVAPVVTEPEQIVTKTETATIEQSQVLPELTPEIISTNSIAKSISSGGVPTNTLLRQIPRITSRGRFSGYTYSFSHVPQRGTYLLHPFNG